MLDFKPVNPIHKFLNSWIIDYEATNTITFDSRDILSPDPTSHTQIKLGNGDCVV